MCSETSTSRCSIARGSVQMRSPTSCSNSSPRCMKAAKLSPRPTGSKNVKRTFEGGIETSSRESNDCTAASAAGREAGVVSNTRFPRNGKAIAAGISMRSGMSTKNAGSSESPPGCLAGCIVSEPKRNHGARSRVSPPVAKSNAFHAGCKAVLRVCTKVSMSRQSDAVDTQ